MGANLGDRQEICNTWPGYIGHCSLATSPLSGGDNTGNGAGIDTPDMKEHANIDQDDQVAFEDDNQSGDDSHMSSIELELWEKSSLLSSPSDEWDKDHPQSPLSTSFSWKRLMKFMGPGFLVSTSFLDPGNFDADIQAGAQFQYSLIWVLICSTVLGLILQNLAARLGVVTGINLAQMCALEYPGHMRYVLWVLSEITIIASDIPEVIGTAFALRFLFRIPLWIGVIATSVSVLLFLMISHFGIRKLEIVIAIMIGVIAICFMSELVLSSTDIIGILSGSIPSVSMSSMYAATSLVGSVVMPHNIFLHSALVQTRPIPRVESAIREACFYNLIESSIALTISLLINIAILSMSASEFYPNPDAGLLSAPSLLQNILKGSSAPVLFAVALLASGQGSTITGTYAGQFVMEGFVNLKVKKWLRALLTRSMAIFPSLIIALIAGEKGADRLIVLSQVVLSVLLPFSLIPLVKVTNCPDKMGVFINSTQSNVIVITLGAGVTIANLVVIIAGLIPIIMSFSGIGSVFVTIISLIVSSLYIYLFIYLIIKPISLTHSTLDIKKGLTRRDLGLSYVNPIS